MFSMTVCVPLLALPFIYLFVWSFINILRVLLLCTIQSIIWRKYDYLNAKYLDMQLTVHWNIAAQRYALIQISRALSFPWERQARTFYLMNELNNNVSSASISRPTARSLADVSPKSGCCCGCYPAQPEPFLLVFGPSTYVLSSTPL